MRMRGWSRSTPSAPSSCPACGSVLTAADVPEAAVIPNRVGAPPGTERYLQPAIARGVVRYVGEPVALVVADDRYVAEDALERIDVVYDPLPACASVADALAPGAPRLFPGTESNNVAVIPMRVGDADRALDTAAVVVRERFTYPRQTAAALETRGLVAVPPDPRGGELHLIGSTKCIHINRTILAPIFGIPVGALRLTEVDVGGGFGVRGELYPEDVLVPLAAMKLGRPVRWIEERREAMMSTNHAREVEYQAEIGLRRGGAHRRAARADARGHRRVRAHRRARAVRVRRRALPRPLSRAELPLRPLVGRHQQDAGGHAPVARAARVQSRPRAADGRGRGPPRPRSRRDPPAQSHPGGRDAVRLRTTSFGASTVYDSGDYPALFDELLRHLDYDRARADQAAHNARPGPRRGIGLAVYVEKTGLGPFETAHVAARADGRFTVDTGAASMGPGLETVLAQILGEALGLPADRFDVRHADTSQVESGVGTYGSRGTVTAGNAANMAAAKLIGEARSRAAARLAVPEAEVSYAAGALSARGQRVTLAELAAGTAAGGGRLVHGAEDHLCGLRGRGHRRRGRRDGRGAPRARGHRGRRRPRGEPRPRRRAARGRRRLRHRQYAPRVARVRRRGQLRSGTLMDYALPYATDVPPVDGFYQEVRATTNPLGLRGLGECGNPGLGGAIANAVCDALRDRGVGITSLPLTAASSSGPSVKPSIARRVEGKGAATRRPDHGEPR
jgi:carbon-monoxide dehydrogenase large subunit